METNPIEELIRKATEVLGSRARAQEWIQEPNPALGGDTPLQAIQTDEGPQRVGQLLSQIEHGLLH